MDGYLTCQNCGIEFDKRDNLLNHQKKFCLNSKYGDLDQLNKNFEQVSKHKDISMYGKMSLAMQGRGFDASQAKSVSNPNIDDEYRKILKEIEEQKNYKNKVEAQRQKAFRELQALQKQQEELVIEDKRTNLQQIINRRQMLAREEQQLQRQLRQYQSKKRQWQKSQAKQKQQKDNPFEHGKAMGKINFERQMLQERRKQMQSELNAKKRQKQKLERQIMQMSEVRQLPSSKATVKPFRSQLGIKKPEQQIYQPPVQHNYSQLNYSQLNNDRPSNRSITQSSKSDKKSYLAPGFFGGVDKNILKFNLNSEGKSEQDRVIQSIMAQEYDDLKILSKLPKGSQIYNMKMKQYTELSKQRMEVQEKAQQQRIQKMKRQFQFEKVLAEKQKVNARWVDDNRKALMQRQLEALKQKNPQQPSINQLNLNGQGDYQVPSVPSIPRDLSSIGNNPTNRTNRNIPSSVTRQQKPNNANGYIPTNPQQLSSYPYAQRPSKRQTTNNKNQFGYKISVISLRNYPLKKPIKIKVIIYEQFYQQGQNPMKYQFTTIYHDENQQDPFNPYFKNKLDPSGAIAYNQSFYVPQNLQNLYNKNQKQIYLLVIAAEKDETKMTNQPKPYCWYSFKVTHFGQIKEGRFTFNLYADDIMYPYPADMNKMKKKKQQEITIELEEVILNEHIAKDLNVKPSQNPLPPRQPDISIDRNLQGTNESLRSAKNTHTSIMPDDKRSSKVNMKYPLRMKSIQDQALAHLDEDYFYSNQKPTQFSHVTLKKPLNFDVSIGGLRTLPSYIGPVKIQLTFIDADNAHVLTKQEILAQISTDLYNPLVNFTKKIRNQTRIPPSTVIFIRYIAISALDYQIYSLGFSLIYLFLNKHGEPIKSNNTLDYLMTSGYYQIPIFWGNIQPQYIEIQDLLDNFPTIPCTSVLIGILQNASKISNQMPKYSEKVYNTILFQIDDNEAKLFSEQYKRQPIDTNTLISGFLQYKGIKKNYSGQQINKYLFKTLLFSQQNIQKKLQLKWMAEYQQYFGINFVIDKLTLPVTKQIYYYFITVCMCPPANYYKNKSFDLNLCRKIDMHNSFATELLFHDNQFFVNPSYHKNTCLIVQINRIQLFQSMTTQASSNIEGYAYGIIPLFQLEEKIRSVDAKQITVELFSGDFDHNNIEKLQKNLKAHMGRSKSLKLSEAELSYRVLNGYFMNQYPPTLPNLKNKSPLYRQLSPSGMNFEDAFEQVNQILSNNYNLQIN